MSAFDEEIEEYLLIERERDMLLALLLYGEENEENKDEENKDEEKES